MKWFIIIKKTNEGLLILHLNKLTVLVGFIAGEPEVSITFE